MSIEEMEKEKAIAEEIIYKALRDFEDKTGLMVYSIDRETVREIGAAPLVRTAYILLDVRL